MRTTMKVKSVKVVCSVSKPAKSSPLSSNKSPPPRAAANTAAAAAAAVPLLPLLLLPLPRGA